MSALQKSRLEESGLMSILTKDAEGKKVALEFTVPLLAPSVNHYKNSRHHVGDEAKAFYEAVQLFARGQYVRFPWYAVEIHFILGPRVRQDVDNGLKTALDGLVRASIIDSDAKITDLRVFKKRGTESSTRYYLREGDNP